MSMPASPRTLPGRPLLILLLIAALTGAVSEAAAAIYRWVDAAGHEHFTMDLEQVPPRYRAAAAAAEKRSHSRMNIVGGGSQDTDDEAATSREPAPREREAQKFGGHDEGWWRSQHRRRLQAVERARQALTRARDIHSYPAYHRGHTRRERAHARKAAKRARASAVAQAEQQLREAEQRLADFLEEARPAGVPPGWLR